MRRWLILAVSLAACSQGETKHDLYMRGMAIEGEAERDACSLEYDRGAQAHVIDGDQVQTCLEKTEQALALYEKAAARGLEDLDFKNTRARALERKQRLENMLRTVRAMEAPRYERELPPGHGSR